MGRGFDSLRRLHIKMIEKTQIETFYRNKKYTIGEIANQFNISYWTLYNLMQKHRIKRRGRSEAGFNFYRTKPQFEIKDSLSITEEKLKVAGIMLYWAEGTLKRHTVDFANSNPEMIKTFLKFLREICGVGEERLRIYLYGYHYHSLEKLKEYWCKITQVPLSQFTKPYIRKGNLNLSNRRLPYGLIHIRYNDKRLLDLIKSWIDEYIRWAGTQVAKRGRLFKKQRLA